MEKPAQQGHKKMEKNASGKNKIFCGPSFSLPAAKPSGPKTVKVVLVLVGDSLVINRIFFICVFSYLHN